MKTLIINGSPRNNGDTVSLINEMIKHLKGEVKVINHLYDNISPCLDCRYCWSNNKCALKDDMQEVYKLLNEVDNVIVASPLYFSQLTGTTLNFASRLQFFYVSRCLRKDPEFKLKRKQGVLVITGGGDGRPDPAVSSGKIILKQMNAELVDTVLSLGTNEVPAKEDLEALSKAREIALKLNELSS